MERVIRAVFWFMDRGIAYLALALICIELVASIIKGSIAGMAFFGLIAAMTASAINIDRDRKEDEL